MGQCVANATCALVGAEDTPHFQKELLTIPANSGGWGLPALGLTKECAYIGRAAATPRIQPWEIPAKHTQNFVCRRTKDVEKAIQNASEPSGMTFLRGPSCHQLNTSWEVLSGERQIT